MQPLALVVDDSMLIRHTVCRFFTERGFAVETATNGLEALDLLKSVRPDLIVTDLSMPKMTGVELITALKQNAETANTPVVVVAAKQSGSHPIEETRADFVIYKDIDIQEQLEAAVSAIEKISAIGKK